MKKHFLWLVGAVVLLAGCGGGGGETVSVAPTAAVPDAAVTSADAAAAYLLQLATVPAAEGDSLEPIAVLPAMLAVSDTTEPVKLHE